MRCRVVSLSLALWALQEGAVWGPRDIRHTIMILRHKFVAHFHSISNRGEGREMGNGGNISKLKFSKLISWHAAFVNTFTLVSFLVSGGP